MLCQKCGVNEANVHMVQVVNGKRTEQHLCSQCAGHQETVLFDTTLSMNKLLSNFFQPEQEVIQKCNQCGLSFNDFTKTGFFGCPECYQTFEQRLEEPLRRLHGTTIHRGKRLKNEKSVKTELENLQEQLKQAIVEERYERAAELRDQIKEMEGEINGMV